VVPLLTPHYTLIAVDNRGCGGSQRPLTGYDTATMAGDVAELANHLGFDQFRVAGEDWGAAIAYAVAAFHRPRVQQLVSESAEVGRVPFLATVESVETLGGYRLRLRFTDGVTREVDLQRELHGPLFEPLRDEEQFRRVYVDADAGTIVWPNGANLAPEVLYRYQVHRASA
jgi:pimeloyl-ACP methyl ester carboxylesterase